MRTTLINNTAPIYIWWIILKLTRLKIGPQCLHVSSAGQLSKCVDGYTELR